MRELRSITHKKSNQRTWFRIANDVRNIGQKLSKNKVRDWVSIIDNELSEYNPIKIKLENISLKSKILKGIFNTLNLLKIPSPTIEFKNGATYVHYLYF